MTVIAVTVIKTGEHAMKFRKLCAAIAVIAASFFMAYCGERDYRGLMLGLNQFIPNQAPVADAGADRTTYLFSGTSGSVDLDGSGSHDPEGKDLTYAWTLVFQPAGSAASFSNSAGATTTLSFDLEGTYEIRLTVNDGSRSASDLVTVNVGTNVAAAADAGADQEVTAGNVVTLDGSGSTDPENNTLAYTWTQVSGPAIGTGTLTGATPTFTAPSGVCTIVYDLQVDDGGGNSAPDRVYIYVMEKGGAGIYASTAIGDDANDGMTRTAPKKTIQGAITAANAAGYDVYVSDGDYGESVALANGVSIYGGFLHGTWERDTSSYQSTIHGGTTAVDGNGVGNLVLDGIVINSADAVGYGEGSYAVRLKYSTVAINDCAITAGNGAPGRDGANITAPGATGAAGSKGGPGNDGGYFDYGENDTEWGWGGAGGVSDVGRTGGKGGIGGYGDIYNGNNGKTGLLESMGQGLGGTGGRSDYFYDHDGEDGNNGNTGATGPAGTNGAGGSSGSVINGKWISSVGSAGEDGGPGQGGGGGGGGGGSTQGGYEKGPGGGGGAGGGGGGGAPGGAGGGASFGLFMIESIVTVTHCTISSGNGGSGGKGGNGGPGGPGGGGGAGGDRTGDDYENLGRAGAGGAGGTGGRGGHGGGGAGGPSFSIYKVGWFAVINTDNTTLNYGSMGSGGASSGNAGDAGDSGQHGG